MGAVTDNYELGANGPVVSRVGLGCMGMSDFYGPADEAESIATIHAAMDAGVTLLDTGDKALAGALIFVAVVANGIEAIVYFIGP